MRNFIKILAISVLITGCSLIQGYDNFTIVNEYGRSQLRPEFIIFNDSLNNDSKIIINYDAIYFYNRYNSKTGTKYYKLIRFFEGQRYAFYACNQNPIQDNNFDIIEYNDLKKPAYVGYYKLIDSTLTLEKPNHLFRRAGRRNLDEYKILPDGNLKSITRDASDFKAVYEIISNTDIGILPVVPDW